MTRTFTLASRGSQLAQIQTNIVRDACQQLFSSDSINHESKPTFKTSFIITTGGDNNRSQPLYLLGGKGPRNSRTHSGLVRLGMGDRATSDMVPPTLYYAVSQGALAVEVRSDDSEAIELCKKITHRDTFWRCMAERACLRVLEGGCSAPVGVESTLSATDDSDSEILTLTGCVTSTDGKEHVQHTLKKIVTSLEDAEKVGEKLAEALMEIGAKKILDDINLDRDRGVVEAKSLDEAKEG